MISTLLLSCSLELDYQVITCQVLQFSDDLFNEPEVVLSCLGIALNLVLALKGIDYRKLNIRISNYPPIRINSLNPTLVGRFVAICGTVLQVGNVRQFVTQMRFECTKCKSTQLKHMKDARYKLPASCTSRNCESRSFTPDRESEDTISFDMQRIKIQEDYNEFEDITMIKGSIYCELYDDLVTTVMPGDIVNVTGILSGVNLEQKQGKMINSIYVLKLKVVHIESMDRSSLEHDLTVSEEDKKMFSEIARMDDLFNVLIKSMCPLVFGQGLVKAGLLLALFGGNGAAQSKLDVGNDLHILIVGDPGIGKTQLLTAVNNLAPRGIYVSGASTTKADLTASLNHETGSDYSIKAGALVLADRGCCLIDEFDKFQDQSCLLESMELQRVSIAKNGVVCSLPSRTSIIAASNPASGHYNSLKSVTENLKIHETVLSRFDLIFVLVDTPNQEHDYYLSKHIMDVHCGQKNTLRYLNQVHKEIDGTETTKLTQQKIRKYISYARANIRTTMSQEATKIVEDYYFELRSESTDIKLPVTSQSLESLVSLCHARAKMELRSVVTEEDAQQVINI